LSEDIIKQARNVRRMVNFLEIYFETSYGSSAYHLDSTRNDLINELNALTVAESTDNKAEIIKIASKVLQLYTILSSGEAVHYRKEAIFAKYNQLVDDYNVLLDSRKKIREQADNQVSEMRNTLNDAFDAKGIAEGKFIAISEKYDKLIQALREAAIKGGS